MIRGKYPGMDFGMTSSKNIESADKREPLSISGFPFFAITGDATRF